MSAEDVVRKGCFWSKEGENGQKAGIAKSIVVNLKTPCTTALLLSVAPTTSITNFISSSQPFPRLASLVVDAPPLPPLSQQPPQDVFDLTLRKLVSLSVSKDVSRAKHANDVRKSVLKLRKEDKSISTEYVEADAIRMWEDAKGDDVTTEYAELSQSSSTQRPDLPEEPPSPPSDPNAFTPQETAAIISNLRTFGFASSPSDLTSLILAKGGKSHKDWEHTIACGEKMMECLGGMESVKKVFERTVVDGRWEQAGEIRI